MAGHNALDISLVKTLNEEWFQYLIEELQSIITETVFASNMEILKGKWFVGQAIEKNLERFSRAEIYGAKVNNIIAKRLNCSETTVKYCRLFYKSYPAIDWSTALTSLPEGKNITWHKIVNQYLPEKSKSEEDNPEQECQHEKVEILIRCARCRERLAFRVQDKNSSIDLTKLANNGDKN